MHLMKHAGAAALLLAAAGIRAAPPPGQDALAGPQRRAMWVAAN